MVPESMKLSEREVTCVVTCRHKLHEDEAMSSSAIFISPTHVLAPGCLFSCCRPERCDLKAPSSFDFEILMPKSLATVAAQFITTWTCKNLAVAINGLFLSGDFQHCPADTTSEETVAVKLISQFVLLQLPDTHSTALFLPIEEIDKWSHGAKLLACMTPFACSQAVNNFYNSWSSGIVSKDIEEGVACLTDVPCVPGGQGGIVYLNASMKPVGIVLYPVVWKSQEPTGLSIIGDLSAVISSLHAHLKTQRIVSFQLLLPVPRTFTKGKCATNPRLVRVRNGCSWGSGILLSSVYVLTCSHVLKGHKSDPIVIEGEDLTTATLCYRSTNEECFDVAILKLTKQLEGISLLPPVQPVLSGTEITAEGYGLFQHGNSTIISSGIVAKCYPTKEHSYILATTCKVHPGSSGGAIVNKSGQIIAMIIANTYDSTHKTLYTGVSMAMSLRLLYPSIIKLCTSNDDSGLRLLEQALSQVNLFSAIKSKL